MLWHIDRRAQGYDFAVNVDWKWRIGNLSFNKTHIHVRKPNFQRFISSRGVKNVSIVEFFFLQNFVSCKIWGSHGGDYEEYLLPSGMHFWNIGKLAPDYLVLHPRRWYSSLCELYVKVWKRDWLVNHLFTHVSSFIGCRPV